MFEVIISSPNLHKCISLDVEDEQTKLMSYIILKNVRMFVDIAKDLILGNLGDLNFYHLGFV